MLKRPPAPPPTGVSAALFDLDGTLVASEYLNPLAWDEVRHPALSPPVGTAADRLSDSGLSAQRQQAVCCALCSGAPTTRRWQRAQAMPPDSSTSPRRC
jgi:beta-phosphoglucomutase-like phosphatase (HAD superfamily)